MKKQFWLSLCLIVLFCTGCTSGAGSTPPSEPIILSSTTSPSETDELAPWSTPTRTHEALYTNLNLDGTENADDEAYVSVYSWDDHSNSDTIVVSIRFGTGDTVTQIIAPTDYSYAWGYEFYTGKLFSDKKDAIVIEVPVPQSNYGAADVYVFDVYGGNESNPPNVIERLNTETGSMRLPTGEVSDIAQIFPVGSITDGSEIVDIGETAVQGLKIYSTGSNGDWRERNQTIHWTDNGWTPVG